MLPLTIAPYNVAVTVNRVTAEEKTKRHLENLGITGGAELVPLSSGGGNVIVKVRDSRLALNNELAGKIYVNV